MVKVIFLENVEDYKIGDVKDVSDGYARNFLFARGKAEVATDAKLKEVEANLSKLKAEESKRVTEAKQLMEKIKKTKLVLTEEVNEEGHLYGSVTNREIADKLEELKFNIDPANIEIESPIKELGDHEVLLKVGHGIEDNIIIKVERLEA
jgi:large subunit ribosomal protein L9